MRLAKLRKQHRAVEAKCAECMAHVNDADTSVYKRARKQYRSLFAAYLRDARATLRKDGLVCIGMPCLPYNTKGAFFEER